MSQTVLGTLCGRAAVRELLEGWWATWEDHHHHIQEIRDWSFALLTVVGGRLSPDEQVGLDPLDTGRLDQPSAGSHP